MSIVWTAPAPAECIDAADLEQELTARLGQVELTQRQRARHVLTLRFRGEAGMRAVSMELRASTGESLGTRELTSSARDCRELRALLPVVAAMMLDLPAEERPDSAPVSDAPSNPKQAPARRDASTQKPERASDEAAAPRLERDREVTRSSSESIPHWDRARDTPSDAAVRSGLDPAVGALLEASWGLLPGTTWALSLEGALKPKSWLELDVWGSASSPSSTTGEPNAVFRFAALGTQLCPTLSLVEGLSVGACLGGSAHLVWAEGSALQTSRTDQRLVALGRAMGRFDVRLMRHVSARFDAGIGLPYPRPRYEYVAADGSAAPLFQPAQVVPIAKAGLMVNFD